MATFNFEIAIYMGMVERVRSTSRFNDFRINDNFQFSDIYSTFVFSTQYRLDTRLNDILDLTVVFKVTEHSVTFNGGAGGEWGGMG